MLGWRLRNVRERALSERIWHKRLPLATTFALRVRISCFLVYLRFWFGYWFTLPLLPLTCGCLRTPVLCMDRQLVPTICVTRANTLTPLNV